MSMDLYRIKSVSFHGKYFPCFESEKKKEKNSHSYFSMCNEFKYSSVVDFCSVHFPVCFSIVSIAFHTHRYTVFFMLHLGHAAS